MVHIYISYKLPSSWPMFDACTNGSNLIRTTSSIVDPTRFAFCENKEKKVFDVILFFSELIFFFSTLNRFFKATMKNTVKRENAFSIICAYDFMI